MTDRWTALFSLALTGVMALGLPQMAAGQETIKIGVIGNITGSNVEPSVDMVRGAEAAAEAVNAAGGIDGNQLELIVEDSEYRLQEALTAAAKLYDVDGVQSVVMFGGSNLMLPVAEMARDKGRVLINNSSSSPLLAGFPGTLFSVIPLDDIVGKALGEWVYAQGVRTASFVVPNNAFGNGLMEAAAASFEASGGTVKLKTAYTEGQPDYRAEVQALVRSDPEAVITAGYGDDSHKWFRLARTLGFEKPWYAAYPSILSVEDPVWMAGKLFGVDSGGLERPEVQDLVQAYRDKYGKDPLAHYLYGFDAVTILALALQAGGNSAQEIAAALPGVVAGYDGKTGKIEWDDMGQRINPPLDHITYEDSQFKVMK